MHWTGWAGSAALSLALSLAGGAALAADVPVSAGASYNLPLSSLKAARFRSTLHQQYDFSCGSAALATLLTYHYERPTSEQQAFNGMYAGGDQARIRREGFSLLDMKRYLAELGFVADGYALPLDKLSEARYPAIVVINENGYHHFVVVKGLAADRVLLGDPAGGTRAISRSAFEARWIGHLLFVIHGWPGAVHFNQATEWQVAPRAVLGDAVSRASLADITLFKLGSGNF